MYTTPSFSTWSPWALNRTSEAVGDSVASSIAEDALLASHPNSEYPLCPPRGSRETPRSAEFQRILGKLTPL